MPLLGLRDRNQTWADGDDDRACCPATLDRLIGSKQGRWLALGILHQIEKHGELDFCLSLYPQKAAGKLYALMLAERLRIVGLRRAVV